MSQRYRKETVERMAAELQEARGRVRELEGQIDRLTLDLEFERRGRDRVEARGERLLPLARAWVTHVCEPDDWRQEYGATMP